VVFLMSIVTAVAVSTLMLVALGDKLVRRKPGNRRDGSAMTPPVQGRPCPATSANAQIESSDDNHGMVHPVQAVASEDDENLRQHSWHRR
jgi:hypothetical protein